MAYSSWFPPKCPRVCRWNRCRRHWWLRCARTMRRTWARSGSGCEWRCTPGRSITMITGLQQRRSTWRSGCWMLARSGGPGWISGCAGGDRLAMVLQPGRAAGCRSRGSGWSVGQPRCPAAGSRAGDKDGEASDPAVLNGGPRLSAADRLGVVGGHWSRGAAHTRDVLPVCRDRDRPERIHIAKASEADHRHSRSIGSPSCTFASAAVRAHSARQHRPESSQLAGFEGSGTSE